MKSLFALDRRPSPARLPVRQGQSLAQGSGVFRSGDQGLAWRVEHGVVRLDTSDASGCPRFASLAIAGDILGCETLLFGCYTFTATALTECTLSPWPEGEAATSGDSLLASLAQAQRRAAEIVALRGGQAAERVLGLIRLLADSAGQVVLPARQDIADITDLRLETISRIIGSLARDKRIESIRLDGIHATRSFRLLGA